MVSRIAQTLIVLGSLAVACTQADLHDRYQEPSAPANYQYKYEVKDDYSGQDFGQEEARSGYNTDGEYQVLLPDGRRQIVTYKVLDGESGYIADVKYEGYAKEEPYHPKPAPSYTPKPYVAPAPSYAPAPQPYAPAPQPYAPRPYAPAPKVYTPAPKVYTPAPKVYAPAPKVYTPRPYVAPSYKPSPTYGPAPRPVKYGPALKPTSRPYARSTTVAPRPVTETYAPIAAPTSPPKYRQPTPAPYKAEPAKPVKSKDTPTYNPAKTVKRRMKYPKKLVAASTKSEGSLFRGDVKKGKLRNPSRARA